LARGAVLCCALLCLAPLWRKPATQQQQQAATAGEEGNKGGHRQEQERARKEASTSVPRLSSSLAPSSSSSPRAGLGSSLCRTSSALRGSVGLGALWHPQSKENNWHRRFDTTNGDANESVTVSSPWITGFAWRNAPQRPQRRIRMGVRQRRQGLMHQSMCVVGLLGNRCSLLVAQTR
jgi:hypothetical protein